MASDNPSTSPTPPRPKVDENVSPSIQVQENAFEPDIKKGFALRLTSTDGPTVDLMVWVLENCLSNLDRMYAAKTLGAIAEQNLVSSTP